MTEHHATPHEAMLRLPDVRHRTGLSASTIYARMAAGDFPMVRRDGGIAYWLASEVQDYIAKVIARSALGPAEVKRTSRWNRDAASARMKCLRSGAH